MNWARGRGEVGTSVVEVTVVVALFAAVTAIFGPLLTSSLRATNTAQNESRALDEIRVAVGRIDRELRSAECITVPAAGASGSTLAFRTYAGTGSAYDVTYRVEAGELVRDVGGAASKVGEGLVVTSEEFEHTANPGQRAFVSIQLQVNFGDQGPREVSTVIAGRNAWNTCP